MEKHQKNLDIPDLRSHLSVEPEHRLRTLQEALVLYNGIVRTGGHQEVSEAITIMDAAAGESWAPMSVAICHARLSLIRNRLA